LWFSEKPFRKTGNVRGPYGFDISESCPSCQLRKNGFFCQVRAEALTSLNAVKSSAVYPAGSVLFAEKQQPRGVFIVCEGDVKLSVNSSGGKTLIVGIAKSGDVLGLSATIHGTLYELTAETLRPCQIVFVRGPDFQRFIAHNPEIYRNIAQHLSTSYDATFEQVRALGLLSPSARLARILLQWSSGAKATECGTRITVSFTHEEIGEFIGTSRETVSRMLCEFKTRRLITLKGSSLTIPNRAALEDIAATA
jgi:CRP/FNR family transcriptional regulator, cyclic AMP receptor protein